MNETTKTLGTKYLARLGVAAAIAQLRGALDRVHDHADPRERAHIVLADAALDDLERDLELESFACARCARVVPESPTEAIRAGWRVSIPERGSTPGSWTCPACAERARAAVKEAG